MWLSSPWAPHCKTCGLWFWENSFSLNYWLPNKLRLANFIPERVKIGATFSSSLEILRNFLQGSILRPIMFNLFINNFMFWSRKQKSRIGPWYYHILMFIKGITKWAEPCKCVILFVSRILRHKKINPSLKEWRFWYLILRGHFLP